MNMLKHAIIFLVINLPNIDLIDIKLIDSN